MTRNDPPLRRVVLSEVHSIERLVRPPFALLLALFLAIGVAQTEEPPSLGDRALMVLALAGWMLTSVALNDLADVEIDRVNLPGDPRRQLAHGVIEPLRLEVLAAIAALLACGAALALGRTATIVVAAGLTLSAAYSMPPVRLGSRGALTSALLPLGYVAVPFLLGLSTGPAEVSDRSWLLLSGLYLGFIGRLALKDFRDQRGDSLYGKRTFLVRYGRTSTARFGAAFMLLGGLVTAAAVPKASWATWACVGVQLTAATWLLRRVARDRHGVDDRANILALAILGRLLLVVVLLQCWGSTHGWSTHLTSALVSLATVLCLAIAAHRWRTSRSFELGDPADLAALPPPRVHRPATIPR